MFSSIFISRPKFAIVISQVLTVMILRKSQLAAKLWNCKSVSLSSQPGVTLRQGRSGPACDEDRQNGSNVHWQTP